MPEGDQQTPTPTTTAADTRLTTAVQHARTGDEDAFRHLYHAMQPRLLNYLRAQVGETDAEDIASETWTRIARDIRTFTGDADGFRGWTTTIARHRAIDHLRRRRPTIPLPLEEIPGYPAPDNTEQAATDALSTTAALALIAALPHQQAQAILLRVVIGLDTATAARTSADNRRRTHRRPHPAGASASFTRRLRPQATSQITA